MPIKKQIPESIALRKRFIEICDYLYDMKYVRTMKELCEALDMNNTSNLDKMRKDQRDPTIVNLILLNKTYNVSFMWLFKGEGDRFEKKKK